MHPDGGGPPNVVARLAAAQAGLGHEVTVVSCDTAADQPDIDRSLAGIPGIERVRFERLEPVGMKPTLMGKLPGRLVELVGGHQVAHLHGVWEPLLVAAGRAAQRADVPYCLCPHGMLDPYSLAQKRVKKWVALRLIHRRLLNRAAFLHVLNGEEHRLLRPLGLTAPMRVIGNGVFLEEVEPLPEAGAFRAAHPELGDRPYVLFLSRLHYKKGLDYLAEAFAQIAGDVPGLQLVVAGPDGGMREKFERMIAQAGLTQRVHLVGPLYGREKFAAMTDATLFCLPSRQEGFSIAILEALTCGVPVVVSKACHFPELTTHRAGLEVALSPVTVAKAMLGLLNQPAEARGMAEQGRELVESRFTWPRIAEQTIDAYHDVQRP